MKKIVMCFGTFDGLHPGHEDYFRQAKEYGDTLIVIVARDVTVMDVKGDLPSRNEEDRLSTVREHPLVDEALFGNVGDKYRVIEQFSPDYLCLGYDQEAFTENLDGEMARRGLSPTVVRCEPFFPEMYKSSLLRGMREEEMTVEEAAEFEERGLTA